MVSLDERIGKIEKRNRKVEGDKAWEGSWTRKLMIVGFTYIALGVLMNAVKSPDPWINAIIPTFGFILSTLTLPLIKTWWINNIYKKS